MSLSSDCFCRPLGPLFSLGFLGESSSLDGIALRLDAAGREPNDAEREPDHRLRHVGSFMVLERGNKRDPTRERKEKGRDARECDFRRGLTGIEVFIRVLLASGDLVRAENRGGASPSSMGSGGSGGATLLGISFLVKKGCCCVVEMLLPKKNARPLLQLNIFLRKREVLIDALPIHTWHELAHHHRF